MRLSSGSSNHIQLECTAARTHFPSTHISYSYRRQGAISILLLLRLQLTLLLCINYSFNEHILINKGKDYK